MEIKKQKALLRKRILAFRRAQSPEEIREKSEKIRQRLFTFNLFCGAGTVLFYLAIEDEVQTKKMISESLHRGKRVAVPFINWQRREILPSELKDPQKDLEVGIQKIPQPRKNFYRSIPPASIDLVIVPGVVFDKKGNRLGFGVGFYDRFLGKLSEKTNLIALAFELQLVDNVPSRSHDIAVDYLITERGIIDCKKS